MTIDRFDRKPTLARSTPARWVALAFAGITLAACARQQAAPSRRPPPPGVIVTPVAKAAIAGSSEYVGRTESIRFVDLRARITGFLTKRAFEEGGHVSEGDLLYVIEQEPFQAAVDAATASVAQTEATLQNAEKYSQRLDAVKNDGGTSKADIDAAERAVLEGKALLKQRRAKLTQAQIDYGYTEIRAPISGRIGRTAIHAGNLVGPSSGILATIVKLDPIWVSFPISERDYLQFQQKGEAVTVNGQVVPRRVPSIRLVDGSVFPYKGKIDFVDNRVDKSTGTILLRATFPNPQRMLRPGQFVTVVLKEPRPTERLVIPQSAVQRDQVGAYVFVVDAKNTARIRRIQLGAQTGTRWIVTGGLKEGELVITQGMQSVRPDAPVKPTRAAGENGKGSG